MTPEGCQIGSIATGSVVLTRVLAVLAVMMTLCCVRADETGHDETRTSPQTVQLGAGVRARALTPGEPLRIIVESPIPLASLGGTFLGRDIFFARGGTAPLRDEAQPNSPGPSRVEAAPDPGGNEVVETWSGWAIIDLDQEPGPRQIALRGRTADGREVEGGMPLTIEPKDFPVDRLEVASKYVEPPPDVQKRIEREQRRLAEVYARRSAIPSGTPGVFARPVTGPPTSVFGTRRLFNGQPRSPHPGLDLRAGEGTPVRSSGPGVVALATDLYFSGNTVIVDHGGGMFTIYAHLSEIRVREGDDVSANQLVGLSGATGRVTAPHLHWGAKVGELPFDPTALLDPALFR